MNTFKTMITVGLTGITVALAACGDQSGHMGARPVPSSFSSNGERIYFTVNSTRNTKIQSQGGFGHMQMMGGSSACASCHGYDRQGGIRMMPLFWLKTPPLTAQALFGAGSDHSSSHGDHDVYDETTLSRAIREGIDPSGEMLNMAMPQWQMSEQDMQDLIAFLKS